MKFLKTYKLFEKTLKKNVSLCWTVIRNSTEFDYYYINIAANVIMKDMMKGENYV